MGQRRRDICAGVRLRKDFLAPVDDFGECLSSELQRFNRKVRVIKQLTVTPRGGRIEAAERIAGLVERTPLIESEVAGARVWLKCECLQTGGAFKLRGATNRLLQLD